jgi:hypothetical protein
VRELLALPARRLEGKHILYIADEGYVRRKSDTVTGVRPLTNEQAVVVAVAQLGGQYRVIDTEDIAVAVAKIAPGRFMWRKYPSFINIELVHTALRDAKRLRGLLTGSGSSGWQLSPEGLALAGSLKEGGLAEAAPRQRLDAKERVWMTRERSRLLAEDALLKFRGGGSDQVTVREAERFFRVDDYVVGPARQQRIQRALNFFGSDPELGTAIRELAKKVTS